MSKSGKKFSCSILEYLERNKPDVYQVIKELCMGGALKPFKGMGVTFVVPAASTMKELTAKIDSEKEDDIRSAIEIIKAHILLGVFDCSKNKLSADTANKLNKQIGVKSVDKNCAELSNGTSLTVDGGFRNMPDRDLSSVLVASGPMPTDGKDADSSGMRTRRAERPPVDGADEQKFDRNECADQLCKKDGQARGMFCLSRVVSLLKHLEKKDSFNRALATLDMSPYASFYLLLEPYADNRSKKVVSDEDLSDWSCTESDSGSKLMKEYIGFIEKANKLMKKDVDDVVDTIRWDITSGGIAKKHIMESISRAYDVEKLKKMYEDQDLAAWFADKSFKLWQDQARFHINYMVTYYEQSVLEHIHDWLSIDSSVRAMMKDLTPFLTIAMDKAITSNVDFFTGPVAFIESHSFLYWPTVKVENVSGALEDGVYGANQDVVAECAGAGTGKVETLEHCAGCL
jgi:hypothetical protein